MLSLKRITGAACLLFGSVVMAAIAGPAWAAKKPNILVIMTDDVGMWNLSAYHRGMMGGRTPNIDRIADEGALFTDLSLVVIGLEENGAYNGWRAMRWR